MELKNDGNDGSGEGDVIEDGGGNTRDPEDHENGDGETGLGGRGTNDTGDTLVHISEGDETNTLPIARMTPISFIPSIMTKRPAKKRSVSHSNSSKVCLISSGLQSRRTLKAPTCMNRKEEHTYRQESSRQHRCRGRCVRTTWEWQWGKWYQPSP